MADNILADVADQFEAERLAKIFSQNLMQRILIDGRIGRLNGHALHIMRGQASDAVINHDAGNGNAKGCLVPAIAELRCVARKGGDALAGNRGCGVALDGIRAGGGKQQKRCACNQIACK